MGTTTVRLSGVTNRDLAMSERLSGGQAEIAAGETDISQKCNDIFRFGAHAILTGHSKGHERGFCSV
jgi:hypothetical protein